MQQKKYYNMEQRIQKTKFKADITFTRKRNGGLMPETSATLVANGLEYGDGEPYAPEDFDSLVWLLHDGPNETVKVVGARMLDVWDKRDAEEYVEMVSEATGWEYADILDVLLRILIVPDRA